MDVGFARPCGARALTIWWVPFNPTDPAPSDQERAIRPESANLRTALFGGLGFEAREETKKGHPSG